MEEEKEINWEHHMQRDKIGMIKELLDEMKKQRQVLEEIRDELKKE